LKGLQNWKRELHMSDATTIEQIRLQNPFPWNQVISPQGLVHLIDSKGFVVPLFMMTRLCVLITAASAAAATKQGEAA
jgi:hypothetical protein